jgi:hypothetical protein
MSRETDFDRQVKMAEVENQNRQAVWERMYGLIIFGSKSLATLNGAGVIAMLAFMQSLLGNQPSYLKFKWFGVSALILFILGSFLSSIIFIAQYKRENYLACVQPREYFWRRIMWGLIFASSFCALIAGIVVVIGIAIAI